MTTETDAPGLTPSQTVGPFFAYALTPAAYDWPELATGAMAGEGAAGERILLEGRVLDGDGAPVGDAMLEFWQADAAGRFDPAGNAGFTGFGRVETGADGGFRVETVRPGAASEAGAPHIAVRIFARGLLTAIVTRIYFDGDPANDADPVLALAPPERRPTLLAQDAGAGRWRFDIRLQGAGETVFFAC